MTTGYSQVFVIQYTHCSGREFVLPFSLRNDQVYAAPDRLFVLVIIVVNIIIFRNDENVQE